MKEDGGAGRRGCQYRMGRLKRRPDCGGTKGWGEE
jgi:hypothetical protein